MRRLPEQWAERLIDELHAINETAATALQRALQQIWPAFVYDGGCAHDLFLMELAARLNQSDDAGASAARARQLAESRALPTPRFSSATHSSNRDFAAFPRYALGGAGDSKEHPLRPWGGTLNSAHHFWSPPRGQFHLPGTVKVGPSYGAGAQPH